MASDASDSSEEFYDAEDSTPNSSKTSKWVFEKLKAHTKSEKLNYQQRAVDALFQT